MTIVRDVEENVAKCICGGCPSYPGDNGLFCARGKSEAPPVLRGCACADCEVYKGLDLIGEYYCEEGPCGACGEGPQ